MINLSYNLSSGLNNNLQMIEGMRREILLVSLNPKAEVRLRWEANFKRVFWSVSLSGNSLTKSHVLKILTGSLEKKLNREEEEVLNYQSGSNYVASEWLVSKRNINRHTILELIGLLKLDEQVGYPADKLSRTLAYLQSGNDHPVVQSAVINLALLESEPPATKSGQVARLAALLFLYKYGYDFRGLLVVEEIITKNKATFDKISADARRHGNLTPWLEFYSQCCVESLENALKDLVEIQFHLEIPTSFWNLNDRQKKLVSLFDEPNKSITNRGVQKIFKISQITASRDLSRLAKLGLLYPHGKGRSVYYTKI